MTRYYKNEEARELSRNDPKSVFHVEKVGAWFRDECISFKFLNPISAEMPWTPSGPLVLGSEMPGSGITIGGVLEGVVASLFEPSASKIKDRPPPWFTGYSKEFMKASGKMDGKMQSRIFRAVMKISKDPEKVRGDTQKPLSADFKGMWRYRIGDYRLVYLPIREYGNIVFVDFASRGGVYG